MSNLLASTFFCGAMAVAAPAYAQDEDQTDAPQSGPAESVAQDAGEETIYVTGSRIPQPNLSATSPVTVVNSQEVRLTGTTRTEDLINSLPQAFASQGGNVANGSTGTATLDLRNLGQNRTLVLINGRRLLPGSPGQLTNAADINIIPAAMVERVDVLTGGASSVYGADAVAGVVNFIMDTDFEGLRIDGQYSFYQHENSADDRAITALNSARGGLGFGFPTGNVADGGTFDFTLAFGVGFDDGRGHITAYAGYRDINAVLQGKRDYSACALNATAATDAFTCGGSATSDVGTFLTNVGTFQTATIGRSFIPGSTPYNFGPLNHYQRPDERYVAGLFAEYEINRAIQPYLEFMFMDDRTIAQIAPSGDFGNTSFINCDNPLPSAQQLAILCTPAAFDPADLSPIDPNPATPAPNYVSNFGNLVGQAPIFGVDPDGDGPMRAPLLGFTAPTTFTDDLGNTFNRGILYLLRRNVEGGGRQDTLQHTTFRVAGGMRGDLSDIWSYDAYYQFGRVNFAETYLNDFSITRLTRALDVVTDPDTGQPVCRSVLEGTDPNCVPWDIFVRGGASPESVAYLSTPGFQRGFTEETVANVSVTGSLGEYGLQFPWASSGVGIALGAEYRKERLTLNTDIAFQTGDLAGQGGATLPVSGEYDVREAFAEARIPIVEESFIHELALEIGYRYSDYGVEDRSFSTDTYKVAGFFSPIRDIRFRGGYNRAVRAPNIIDLFASQRVVLNGSTDPCEGAAPTASLAACQRTGVSAAQYGSIPANPAQQYQGLIGGNINLEPEVADTLTVGVVIQPRFIPRLAITVDWFDIEIEGAIQQIGQDTILQECLDTGNPDFCGLINRDARGTLWLTPQGFIVDTTQNIGGVQTRGVDIGVGYSMEIGSLGSAGFNFNGTWLDQLETSTGVGAPFDCVGFYGNVCGVPTPEWRHTARLSLTTPDGIGATLRWRHAGSVRQDSLNPDIGGAVHPAHDRLPSVNYFDLAFSFAVGDHYQFRLGVNNLLDKDPPLVGAQACPAGFCNGNTFAQFYDALGRYVFAGVTLNF